MEYGLSLLQQKWRRAKCRICGAQWIEKVIEPLFHSAQKYARSF